MADKTKKAKASKFAFPKTMEKEDVPQKALDPAVEGLKSSFNQCMSQLQVGQSSFSFQHTPKLFFFFAGSGTIANKNGQW
jgi:hypothetical protein